MLTQRQGLANTLTAPAENSDNAHIVWIGPVEDIQRREDLWARIVSGRPVGAFLMIRPALTFKLSVLLACIGVLASGATGYYAYRANRTMLVNEAEHSLLTSTELLGQRFSASIDDVAADALVLASMPSSAEVAQTDDGIGPNVARERLAQVYSSFMVHHPEYLQVRLITRQHYGLELVRFDRDADGLVRVEGNKLQEKGQFAYVFDTLAFSPGRIYTSPISVNHEYGTHAAEGKPTLAGRHAGVERQWRGGGRDRDRHRSGGFVQAPAKRFAERLSGLSGQRVGRFPG